jgi:hypothetical protein
MAGCASDDLSQIAIRNMTDVPIYALPYSSDFTDGDCFIAVILEMLRQA